MVDEFILYDDVQYTRRDWRNRNKIKTSKGSEWLTIPVEVKGKYSQLIKETKIADQNWGKSHWASIAHNYAKARYFKEYEGVFKTLYLNSVELFLSKVNYMFIKTINGILDIKTKISWSSDYQLCEGRSERLLSLCRQSEATEYISGMAAKDYLDEGMFNKENIRVAWMEYSGYLEYRQLYPPFDHYVSILDLIFNEGPDSRKYMKSFQA
jgi:hypothetical protein